MDVGVVGLGRVGIPTLVGFATLGHRVFVTDRDADRLEAIATAEPRFFEPGLADALRDRALEGRIHLSSRLAEVVARVQVIFVCVASKEGNDRSGDLSALEQVVNEIATYAKGPLVIVNKCTVPPGTGERLQCLVRDARPELDLTVVSNPEFLREGQALEDVLWPHRILVGSSSAEGRAAMRAVYAPLIDGGCPFIETDIRTAELAKYTSNVFLALKTSYANAIAGLCDALSADVVTIATIMGLDPRIAPGGLDAGLGFGGSCLPADVRSLSDVAERSGYAFPLLAEIHRINDSVLDRTIGSLSDELGSLAGKRIALFGLSFKEGTDDTRDSPALRLATRLGRSGCIVRGYDPIVATLEPGSCVALDEGPYEAATNADGVVICTPWAEFRSLDLTRLRGVMAHPYVVDARNVLDPGAAAEAGLVYTGTGRPVPKVGVAAT